MTERSGSNTPEHRLKQSAGSLITCWNEYRDAYMAANLSEDVFNQAKFDLPYVEEQEVNYQTLHFPARLLEDTDRSVIVEDIRAGGERDLRFRIVSNRPEDRAALLDEYRVTADANNEVIDIKLGKDPQGFDKMAELVTSAHIYGEQHGFAAA